MLIRQLIAIGGIITVMVLISAKIKLSLILKYGSRAPLPLWPGLISPMTALKFLSRPTAVRGRRLSSLTRLLSVTYIPVMECSHARSQSLRPLDISKL